MARLIRSRRPHQLAAATAVLVTLAGAGWLVRHPDLGDLLRASFQFRADDPRSGHIGPSVVTVAGGRYVALGRDESATVAWTSTDAVHWRQAPLPGPAGALVRQVTAAPDGRLVAIGAAAFVGAEPGAALAWVSTDLGDTWTSTEVTGGPATVSLTSVLHTGGRFVAFGSADGRLDAPAVALTSPDGLRWDLIETPADMRHVVTAVAVPDGGVLAFSGQGSVAQRPDQQCATAWRWDGAQWSAASLGCDGLPGAATVLADGRVAASFWSTLFLTRRG